MYDMFPRALREDGKVTEFRLWEEEKQWLEISNLRGSPLAYWHPWPRMLYFASAGCETSRKALIHPVLEELERL